VCSRKSDEDNDQVEDEVDADDFDERDEDADDK